MSRQTTLEPALYGFIRSVLRNLSSVLGKERTSSFHDVNPSLKKLEQKLSQFQDLLVDAERRRINKEHSVSRWMEDLNELAYDIDDIVDEINIHYQEIQKQPDTSQIRAADSTSEEPNISNIWYTFNALDRKINKILERVKDLAEVAAAIKLKRDNIGHKSWRPYPRLETTPLVDMSEVYGREEDKNAVIKLLMSTGGEKQKNYLVIPIVGMGGIGKTTLSQLVFEDERVKNFFELRIWVCVTEVFDVAKVTKEIIEYAAIDQGHSQYFGFTGLNLESSLSVLQAILKNMISNKKLLLVLDDVWTSWEWDKLKAPLNFCAKDSKILVTSRSEDVTNVISHWKPYKLGVLDEDQSWALFQAKAFGDIDCDVDEDMEQTGKAITKKCGGVPLAIKVIGALLQGAAEERWKALLENDLWDVGYDGDDQIFPALKLSYYYLPSPLKRCFQYLSIFPTSNVFDKDEVVRMWIAEGFIEAEEGRLLVNVGTQYYNELKMKSLIHEDDRMHDLIHSLARVTAGKFFYSGNNRTSDASKSLVHSRHVSFDGEHRLEAPNLELLAKAKNLCSMLLHNFSTAGSFDELPSWKSLRVLKLYSIGLSVLPRSVCTMRQLRYLKVYEHRLQHFPESICDLVNLLTLDLSMCISLKTIPQNVGCLQNLTYLNLSKTLIWHFPESVCNIRNLQVLDLTDCKNLTYLPERIGNLRGLKKLHLTGSSVLSVPQSILMVTGLQVLDSTSDVELPPSIGKLVNLEQLKAYRVGKGPRRGIQELKGMNRLKGELFIYCMENIETVEGAIMADMKKKKGINNLGFMWSLSYPRHYSSSSTNIFRDGELELKVVEALEPHDPSLLVSLTFQNYSSKRLPQWMSNVGLYSLTHLGLDNLFHLDRVMNIELPSLKLLVIINCPELMEALMIVPNLLHLDVFNCRKLKTTNLVLRSSIFDRSKMNIVSRLESLKIDYIYLDYFLKQVQAGVVPPFKLQKLEVLGFLINVISMPAAWSSILTNVKKLKITNFPLPTLQLLHTGDHFDVSDSLVKMSLRYCPSLTGLPIGMHKLSSITTIVIDNCPSLMSIETEELPTNLSFLCIKNCENLRFLPQGLNKFPCLTYLFTAHCPQLEVHPNHKLPPSLNRFVILRCPRLQLQLTKEDNAQYWLYIMG